EVFARPCAGNRRRAAVGISPGADHRRIADPAPALAGQPAGRGRRRDVARRIAGDRTDRAVLDARIEPAFAARAKFVPLPAPPLDLEPAVGSLLDTMLAGERLGPRPGEEDVRSL